MAIEESHIAPIGWQAPPFKLIDTGGLERSLSEFLGKRGLLVVFTCNHCPYAKAAWPTLITLYREHQRNVDFVAINPNDEVAYPEDSFEEMKQKKKEWGILFSYLRDESQDVARSYKAQCTPDPYLFAIFDGVPRLFYHGRISDNWQDAAKETDHNLSEALARLVRGDVSPDRQPPAMGCSIKWKSQ